MQGSTAEHHLEQTRENETYRVGITKLYVHYLTVASRIGFRLVPLICSQRTVLGLTYINRLSFLSRFDSMRFQARETTILSHSNFVPSMQDSRNRLCRI
jgi:hypothetical protein